jgi:FHS family L-fucose permease-like MFS transporter
MFPTIFSLALNGLGQSTAQASGYLCLAIVGGALVPLLQGFFADTMGLRPSFIVPMLCYLFIAYYGLKGSTPHKD